MKQKSRKLLSRLGAALLLGLSIFNFGAAWNKLRGGEAPRSVRNIRKRIQEDVGSDIKQVAAIAEQEAQAAIALQQLEEEERNSQQLLNQAVVVSHKIAVYAAISVWVVSAGIVFSSAIFNYPFGLGKAILSLLPGVAHVASLQLETPAKFFEVGQEIPVEIVLDSRGELVFGTVFSLAYDPEAVSFERYELKKEMFEKSKEFRSDVEQGVVSVRLENSERQIIGRKDALATVFFRARSQAPTGILIDQKNSFVFKKDKKGEPVNILGKVKAADFRISSAKESVAFCSGSEGNFEDRGSWESLAKGAILPSGKNAWNTIDSDWAFVCSQSGGNELKFLLSGPRGDLENIQFRISAEKDAGMFLNVTEKWQEGERHFFGIVLQKTDLAEGGEIEDVVMEIRLSDKQIRWPESGKAKIISN